MEGSRKKQLLYEPSFSRRTSKNNQNFSEDNASNGIKKDNNIRNNKINNNINLNKERFYSEKIDDNNKIKNDKFKEVSIINKPKFAFKILFYILYYFYFF